MSIREREAAKREFRQQEADKILAVTNETIASLCLPENPEQREALATKYSSLLHDSFNTLGVTVTVDLSENKLGIAINTLRQALSKCNMTRTVGNGQHPRWDSETIHPQAVSAIILRYTLDGKEERTLDDIALVIGISTRSVSERIGRGQYLLASSCQDQLANAGIISFPVPDIIGSSSLRRG